MTAAHHQHPYSLRNHCHSNEHFLHKCIGIPGISVVIFIFPSILCIVLCTGCQLFFICEGLHADKTHSLRPLTRPAQHQGRKSNALARQWFSIHIPSRPTVHSLVAHERRQLFPDKTYKNANITSLDVFLIAASRLLSSAPRRGSKCKFNAVAVRD